MPKDRKPKRKKNRKTGQLKLKMHTIGRATWFGIRRVWFLVLVIVLVLGTRYWLFSTPRFALKNLLVNECERVDTNKLLSFIDARVGTNLLAIDLKAMQQRIQSHHWIKNVCVSRKLPDTLMITISEYEPYALINLGKLYYVNEEGFLFKKLSKNDSLDYPVLSGFTTADFHEAKDSSIESVTRLRTAVRLIQIAGRTGSIPRNKISEIRFDPLIGYSLVLEPKGTEIRLGKDAFEKKLSRYNLIQRQLGDRAAQLTLVDLVNPEQAVIKGLREVNAG